MPLAKRNSVFAVCAAGAAVIVVACGATSSERRRPLPEPYSWLPKGPIPLHSEIADAAGLKSGGPAPTARYCGAIGFVDLGSAVDGPAYYFRKSDGKILGRCGGYCWADRGGHCKTDCPPARWTCRGR
ncbi:MAG TPA: hypothetical protein VF079_03160 [Sphingomicrobium sp.]